MFWLITLNSKTLRTIFSWKNLHKGSIYAQLDFRAELMLQPHFSQPLPNMVCNPNQDCPSSIPHSTFIKIPKYLKIFNNPQYTYRNAWIILFRAMTNVPVH